MSWMQISFAVEQGHTALLEAVLDNAGALAVTLSDAGDDPLLEPPPGAMPLWQGVRLTALFDDDADGLGRVAGLTATLAPYCLAPPLCERIEDRPWERVWLDEFAPMRFGQRLWVCPRGQSPEAADAVVVELDPGLAFGTGHHPTTALCLRWLDGLDLDGQTVLDYGCGSGILAIAALRLGAARAVAVDHDPQALEASLANARENAVADRLAVCAPEDQPDLAADVLLANILAGPLVALAPRLGALVRPGGRIALSGILPGQVAELVAAYATHFDLEGPQTEAGWVLLSGRRQPDPGPFQSQTVARPRPFPHPTRSPCH